MRNLLVPKHYLNRKPDDHFHLDANYAHNLGAHVAFVDDDFNIYHSPKSHPVVEGEPYVYRGWMLTPAAYRELASRIDLWITPDQYERAHHFPGWYPKVEEFTPKSVYGTRFPTTLMRAGTEDCLRRLDVQAAVIRGFSKSLKHDWDVAMFIPDTSDLDAATQVVSSFHGRSSDEGLVFREYEDFSPDEIRTWWIDGECRIAALHPNSSFWPPAVLDTDPFRKVIRGLDHPFLTVDFALRNDNMWRIVEVGDGQVSDSARVERDLAENLFGETARYRRGRS